MLSWSSSPPLQRIRHVLEEQQGILDQLKAYLEVRLAPFQRHVGDQRRNVYQFLRQVEGRLVPVREYFQGEHRKLEQMAADLKASLGEVFEHYLLLYRDLLEETNQRIEGEYLPLQNYIEDERQAVGAIYRDLEQKLGRLIENLSEQQKILESLREPGVMSEYDTLAEYLEERQKVLERYVRFPGYRPEDLFAQLAEVADRHTRLQREQRKLFAKVLEKTALADRKLRQSLLGAPTSGYPSPG